MTFEEESHKRKQGKGKAEERDHIADVENMRRNRREKTLEKLRKLLVDKE